MSTAPTKTTAGTFHAPNRVWSGRRPAATASVWIRRRDSPRSATTTVNATAARSTPSASAVAGSKSRADSMRTVSVSYRRSETAPKSLTTYRKTSSAPAAIAPVAWGRTTERNTCAGDRPSDRAVSSSEGGNAASRAATGRYTYGYESSVSVANAAQNPRTRGRASSPKRSSRRPPRANAAMSANAPTNDGMTSGSAMSTRSSRRSGRSVRITSQASTVPSTGAGQRGRGREHQRARERSGRRVGASARRRAPPSCTVRTTR